MTDEYTAVPAEEAEAIQKDTRGRGRPGVSRTYFAAKTVMEQPGTMLFLPGAMASDFGNAYRRARANGMQLHTAKGERSGVEGVYIWAEFIEG